MSIEDATSEFRHWEEHGTQEPVAERTDEQ
jgi:hypothetical protein